MAATGIKSDMVSKYRQIADQAAKLADLISQLSVAYTANGFQSGGADAITDADIVGSNAGITAVQLAAAKTTLDALAAVIHPTSAAGARYSIERIRSSWGS
jgi:hypothetical protein